MTKVTNKEGKASHVFTVSVGRRQEASVQIGKDAQHSEERLQECGVNGEIESGDCAAVVPGVEKKETKEIVTRLEQTRRRGE